MLGDHRGIRKSLSLLKAIAGFYMVFLHGTTLFALKTPGVDFTQMHWAMRAYSVLKVALAGGLPAFAGYYVRGEVGPFIRNHRLSPHFIILGCRFFVLAVFLEAVRLYFVTFDLIYIFNWNALHFVALAMIVTYLILAIDSRLLIFFVAFLLIGNDWLAAVLKPLEISSEGLTPTAAYITSWLWALSLGGLYYWALLKLRSWKMWRQFSGEKAIFLIFTSASALVVICLGQAYIEKSPRGLISFINLPHSIFFSNNFDDNYWNLVPCYLIFSAGYFLRAFLFNLNYRKFYPWVNSIAILIVLQFFVFRYHLILEGTNTTTTFTKASFMPASTLLGRVANVYLALFYLSFVTLYYLFAHRRTPLLDKFSHASRSILILYLVHGTILEIAMQIFPFHFVERFQGSVHAVLWFIEIAVVLVYVLSLYLSDRIATWLERTRADLNPV